MTTFKFMIFSLFFLFDWSRAANVLGYLAIRRLSFNDFSIIADHKHSTKAMTGRVKVFSKLAKLVCEHICWRDLIKKPWWSLWCNKSVNITTEVRTGPSTTTTCSRKTTRKEIKISSLGMIKLQPETIESELVVDTLQSLKSSRSLKFNSSRGRSRSRGSKFQKSQSFMFGENWKINSFWVVALNRTLLCRWLKLTEDDHNTNCWASKISRKSLIHFKQARNQRLTYFCWWKKTYLRDY